MTKQLTDMSGCAALDVPRESVGLAAHETRKPQRSRSRTEHSYLPRSGHIVEVDAAAGTVRVSNAAGHVELFVRATARGCSLEFASTELQLSAADKLTLECAELRLHASEHLQLHSRGQLTTHVAGDSTSIVAGRSETQAEELALSATRGDAVLYANDRVRVVGEQILLNSEHERQPSTRAELEALWERFGI